MRILSFLLMAFQLSAAEEKISFNEHIRPILSDKCFHCHGPDAKHIKGKLQLHTFELATKRLGKKSARYAIAPGKPEASTVMERILSEDEDELMPPLESHKKLTLKEKGLIKEWISQGAAYQKHWSFESVVGQALPQDENSIDYFVGNKHATQKLSFNREANLATLIQRVSLDLTGLPLSKALREKYSEKNTESSYKLLVDELLASPQYGEHMARYWLDTVRYGDTHGLHADNYREMFAYRDWVIRSFNRNLPFDQFTIEQIAGDLLQKPSTDQLIASGFNRLHISNSAGSALKEELYVNNVKDRINTVGTVFLGLTLGCAACHDHKYDPISQKEYYELFAFFNNMDGPPDNKGLKNPAPYLSLPTKAQFTALESLKSQIKMEPDKDAKEKLKKKLKALSKSVATTLIMREKKTLSPAFILERGEYDSPGEKISRSTPAFLPKMKSSLPVNRLGLAKWLVSKDHPLTARVTVNRLWQQFFGMGLVKTSEDFGSQGKWPTHPELLNQLAHEFIQSDWDIKKFVKQIVMSRTYRQSSITSHLSYKNDPENTFLSRGPRFRMDAEVLRDKALHVSGLLSLKMFGPSVKPPQPKGLWGSVALKASNTKKYATSKGEDIYRRSVYTFWKRALPHPTLTTFNAPTRESCTSRRERTNTPLQALILMNEPQFFEASMKLAELAERQGGSTQINQLSYLYKMMFGVKPSDQDLIDINSLFEEIVRTFDGKKEVDLAKRKLSVKTASLALIANSLMGLDKFKTKE